MTDQTVAPPNKYEVVDHLMADVLSKKTETERLQIAWAIWRSAQRMITRIIRQQMPSALEREIEREVAKRMSGDAMSDCDIPR